MLEVSSFQLEAIEEFRCDAGVILNITPDHLDRHKSFEAYRAAKFRLTENQTEDSQDVVDLTVGFRAFLNQYLNQVATF